jgi:hypothetical protein
MLKEVSSLGFGGAHSPMLMVVRNASGWKSQPGRIPLYGFQLVEQMEPNFDVYITPPLWQFCGTIGPFKAQISLSGGAPNRYGQRARQLLRYPIAKSGTSHPLNNP